MVGAISIGCNGFADGATEIGSTYDGVTGWDIGVPVLNDGIYCGCSTKGFVF